MSASSSSEVIESPEPASVAGITRIRVLGLALTIAVVLGFLRLATFTELPLTGPDPRDAYYNRLAAGLMKGQTSLDRSVPAGLGALGDPYDPAASGPYRRLGPENVHDLSLHQGKLYLYFGITPAVVAFVPYHLVSGGWLAHADAVWLFLAVGFVAQALVLIDCWRRYFPRVRFDGLIAGIGALGLIPPGILLLQRPEVWEVAVTCGFAGVAVALWAIWRALHSTRRRDWWVVGASVAYGAAIGARPLLAFGAVVLFIPWAQRWRRAETSRGRSWRSALPSLAAAVVPVTTILLALLAYNAARFGNLLEFGQRYQLAGDRQDTVSHFGVRFVWFHLRTYFFALAEWKSVFPFVETVAPRTMPVGHGPAEPPWGLFANLPFVWLAAVVAWWMPLDERRERLRFFALAVAVVFVVGTAVACLFYAMMIRYVVEFAPALVWLAVVGAFLSEGRFRLRGIRMGWRGLLIVSIAFNLAAAGVLRADRWHQVAVHRLQAGDLDGAISAARSALKFEPHDEAVQATLADALCQSGSRLGAKGRYADAAAVLREAIGARPRHVLARFYLAQVYMMQEDLATARQELVRALQIDPTFRPAREALAALGDADPKVGNAGLR